MKVLPALLHCSTLASVALAVSIDLALTDDCSILTGLGCGDVPPGVCCILPPTGLLVPAAQFTGLPPTGVGSVHPPDENNQCGNSCGTCTNPEDGNCCASCDDDTTQIIGALWESVANEAVAAESGFMYVNYARFGGQYFRINGDVPQEVTETLMEAALNQTSVEDLPDFVQEYTMVPPS
ncbi:hypothetical protein DL769_002343 [Monosporascus sp. CRB-8-3]|nr:hypothetical protein DL769_002343 [Monosporascus sp. CRB-8-3]